jgi:hypothetical protein
LKIHVPKIIFCSDDVGQNYIVCDIPFSPLRVTQPTEIPITGFVIGIPACIGAGHRPQTLAIDDEPLDSKISEAMRIEYGKTSSGGITGDSERSANAPCPISRGPTVPIFPVSPTENGGIL